MNPAQTQEVSKGLRLEPRTSAATSGHAGTALLTQGENVRPSETDRACDGIRQRLEELRRAFDEGLRRPPSVLQRQGEPFLLLRVAAEAYAYPLRYAMEVMPPPVIVPVPGAPDAVLVIINYRGEIRTVSDLGRILGIPTGGDCPAARLVVTRGLPIPTAFLVDAVEGISEFTAEDLGPVPATVPAPRARCLTGHTINGDRPLFFLDPQQLCSAHAVRTTHETVGS